MIFAPRRRRGHTRLSPLASPVALTVSQLRASQDKNAFKGFDKEFKQPPYRSLEEQGEDEKVPDENPFENTPDNYPFDETEGGHEWKHWDGDSPMDALKEFNALDTGRFRTPFDAAGCKIRPRRAFCRWWWLGA